MQRRFNVSMDEYDYQRLKQLADSQSRGVSNMILWLLRQHLNSLPSVPKAIDKGK